MEMTRNQTTALRTVSRPHPPIRYTPAQAYVLISGKDVREWVTFLWNARYVREYRRYILNGSEVLPRPMKNTFGPANVYIKDCDLTLLPYFALHQDEYIVIDNLKDFIQDFFFPYALGKWDETIRGLRRQNKLARSMTDMPDPITKQYSKCSKEQILPFDMPKAPKKKNGNGNGNGHNGDGPNGGDDGYIVNFEIENTFVEAYKKPKRRNNGDDEDEEPPRIIVSTEEEEQYEVERATRPSIEFLMEMIKDFYDNQFKDAKKRKERREEDFMPQVVKLQVTPIVKYNVEFALSLAVHEFESLYISYRQEFTSATVSSLEKWKSKFQKLLDMMRAFDIIADTDLVTKITSVENTYLQGARTLIIHKETANTSRCTNIDTQRTELNTTRADVITERTRIEAIDEARRTPAERQALTDLIAQITAADTELQRLNNEYTACTALSTAITAAANAVPNNPVMTWLTRFIREADANAYLGHIKEGLGDVGELQKYYSDVLHVRKLLDLNYFKTLALIHAVLSMPSVNTLRNRLRATAGAVNYKVNTTLRNALDPAQFITTQSESNIKGSDFFMLFVDALFLRDDLTFNEMIAMSQCSSLLARDVTASGNVQLVNWFYNLFAQTNTWNEFVNVQALSDQIERMSDADFTRNG